MILIYADTQSLNPRPARRKKAMKRLISSLLLCGLLISPAICFGNNIDALLSSLIIGTWEEGYLPYGTVTFKADGTYEAKMFETRDQQKLLLSLAGTWTIKESELQSLLTASSSSKAPVGETFIDTIVQINRTELVLIGADDEQYSKYRVTPESKE